MIESRETDFLERSRPRLREILEQNALLQEDVSVRVGLLSPEEAIGTPLRQDFPILVGKERVIEARFRGARGHAFTDAPQEFVGAIGAIVDLPFDSNSHRAMYVACLNAVLRHLGRVGGTVHCRDEDPEKCAAEIADTIARTIGDACVGLVGCNPAIAEALAARFGPDRIRITDLDPGNLGEARFGVEVWDGNSRTEDLVSACGLVLITGTTFVNGTFDAIWGNIRRHEREYFIYGVTAAGLCYLFDLKRICPYGRDG